MFTVTQVKEHLTGMGHGGTLNKVRNVYALMERSASNFLLQTKPLETMRTAALASVIHDDVFNYPLPSDFASIVDLYPQDNRNSTDLSQRHLAQAFDLKKMLASKTVSIEGSEGSKVIRINWRSRQGKTLNTMNSVDANGTWSLLTGASNLEADTIFKISGNASIRFDLTATGGGIWANDMDAVDLTDEDEVADCFVWCYFPSVPTSVQVKWGNDLTTKYWTASTTTQSDGTAFKVGWNLLKFSWATATETGTVNPATIDSFEIAITGSAMNNVRVDNILFSIGRNFDIKYYSKYFFKSTSGTYLSRPTTDDDYVLCDNDSLPLYLYECLKEMAHQMEGTDSAFDIEFAEKRLTTLYPHFRAEFPNQSKKAIASYGGLPRFR